MISDLLNLIKTIFFDWIDLRWVTFIAEDLLSDDEYRADRTKGFLKGWIWLMLIAIPLILATIAIVMKNALIWKILLFIPSFTLFIFFLRLWWRNITGE